MNHLRRALALLLILALCLPLGACAEEDVHGLRMNLSFQMDPSAYPAEEQELLQGIGDMMNLLGVQADLAWEGNLLSQDTSFDSNVSLSLGEQADLVRFHLYGTPSHIVVGSNLLGDQQVMLNMLAWLEFSMKTYFYLGMPLQNVALCTSTYAHTSAFEALAAVWNPVMNATQGTRTISRESILDMLPQLADTAQYDRAFTYWLQALLLDAGYDSMVLDALYSAADWADGFLAEDGIQVTVTDQEETWTTGDLTLFHRDGDGWTLALPATGEGYTAHATMTQGEDSRMLRLCFGLEEEADVLDLTLSATGLPTGEDGAGRTELALDRTGSMFGEQHLRWGVDWTRTTQADGLGAWEIRAAQTNADTGAEMLVISGTFTECVPEVALGWDTQELIDAGLNIFSVYEDTLAEFVRNVQEPFLTAMLPVLVELPASSYKSIFQLLEQYGVFDVLSSGLE